MKCYARILPKWMKKPLFGDRDRHGFIPDKTDKDWLEWQKKYYNFYENTQKEGIGKRVNDAGYQILQSVSFEGKSLAEIGPGGMPHQDFWNGTPKEFTAIDISEEFLEITASKITCPFKAVHLTERVQTLPIADNSFDILITFYSLEHLYPLDEHLAEYYRVLKPGGLLVGAIPNEGGLAWGLGRFLTSRRWIKKNTSLDYDKIICWEHPNFSDTIIQHLDKIFTRQKISMIPFSAVAGLDLNLLTKFIYRKT